MKKILILNIILSIWSCDKSTEPETDECKIYNNYEESIIEPNAPVYVGWIKSEYPQCEDGCWSTGTTWLSSCFNPNCTFDLDGISSESDCGGDMNGCNLESAILYDPSSCSILNHNSFLSSNTCDPDEERIIYQVCP